MPAQYTHQIIAETIFERLPENVRDTITSLPAYWLGAQGGDMYYFFRIRKGKERNLGTYLHNRGIYEVFSSFLKAARGEDGAAWSYIAGYITHYAADAVFHPYVYALMGRFSREEPAWRGKRHAYIESDLDSYFIEKYRNASVREYVSPVSKKDADALPYDLMREVCRENGSSGFSERALRSAFKRFFLFERLFTDRSYRRRKFFTGVENAFRLPHVFSSLYRRPDYDERCLNRDCAEWTNPSDTAFSSKESADRLFERSVREGVRLIDTFFICMEGGTPLPREDFGKGFLTGADESLPLVRADKPTDRDEKEPTGNP